MKEKDENTELYILLARNEFKNDIQGYPIYPPGEDFYSKFQKENGINPDTISMNKGSGKNDLFDTDIETGSNKNLSGNDLDIPGSELDDNQEAIGSEDEENNYYSLGGDDHNDLDENKIE